MKLLGLRSLVTSSVLLMGVAVAATRPHYGGTLRIGSAAVPVSVDPLQQSDSSIENNLTSLIFDTLTRLDDRGVLQPSLATSWQADPGDQRWNLVLRSGVTFSDGSPLSPEAVATSLSAANPKWKVLPGSNSISIVTDSPDPSLMARLALPKNAIVKRVGASSGTGPFMVTDLQPGKKLTLLAREDCWRGRPFLDSVQVLFGQNTREQMIDLHLGKVDVVELAAQDSRRAGLEKQDVVTSQPIELVALVFAHPPSGSDDDLLRRALALSIDRVAINDVLLQGAGVTSASLLPNWMSGYSFLFSPEPNLVQARELRSRTRQPITWTLSYDVNNPLSRTVADRVALNARDAGITIHVSSSASSDIRLSTLKIDSVDSGTALELIAKKLELPVPNSSDGSAEELFSAESSMLRSGRIIPLLHVRDAHAFSGSVMNWHEGPDGSWHLEDVWMGAQK